MENTIASTGIQKSGTSGQTNPVRTTNFSLKLKNDNVPQDRYAARVVFKKTDGLGGLYAAIPVPLLGKITSIAVKLNGETPAGKILLTQVNPAVSVDGAFMYVFLEDVLPAASGPAMYRRTDIYEAAYTTQATDHINEVFALLIGGSSTDGLEADVAVTVKSS